MAIETRQSNVVMQRSNTMLMHTDEEAHAETKIDEVCWQRQTKRMDEPRGVLNEP